MGKNTSKRHHYLPRYYLSGFTDSVGGFYIYDKLKDNIFATSPSAAFFENNLNTVALPNGSSSDFLEDLYTEMENQFWSSLDRIRESTSKTPIELLDKMQLFLFLLFLYWRLPSNIKVVEELSEKAFLDNSEFDYLKLVNRSGGEAPKGIKEIMKKSPAFKKSFRQVIPFAPFFKDKGWAFRLENWRFLYTEGKENWNVVGDSPIILRGDDSHNSVNFLREFVFPISGKILLVSLDNPLNRVLPPDFTIQFNAAMIEKAQRFIACSKKDFLEAVIKYHKLYVQHGKTNMVIPDMFEMLER